MYLFINKTEGTTARELNVENVYVPPIFPSVFHKFMKETIFYDNRWRRLSGCLPEILINIFAGLYRATASALPAVSGK